MRKTARELDYNDLNHVKKFITSWYVYRRYPIFNEKN
jgi:hypothetical protein